MHPIAQLELRLAKQLVFGLEAMNRAIVFNSSSNAPRKRS